MPRYRVECLILKNIAVESHDDIQAEKDAFLKLDPPERRRLHLWRLRGPGRDEDFHAPDRLMLEDLLDNDDERSCRELKRDAVDVLALAVLGGEACAPVLLDALEEAGQIDRVLREARAAVLTLLEASEDLRRAVYSRESHGRELKERVEAAENAVKTALRGRPPRR